MRCRKMAKDEFGSETKLQTFKSGEIYVLVIKDDASKYVWLLPCKSADAEAAYNDLLDWFATFGRTRISDQDTHFKNKTIEALQHVMGAHHHFITARIFTSTFRSRATNSRVHAVALAGLAPGACVWPAIGVGAVGAGVAPSSGVSIAGGACVSGTGVSQAGLETRVGVPQPCLTSVKLDMSHKPPVMKGSFDLYTVQLRAFLTRFGCWSVVNGSYRVDPQGMVSFAARDNAAREAILHGAPAAVAEMICQELSAEAMWNRFVDRQTKCEYSYYIFTRYEFVSNQYTSDKSMDQWLREMESLRWLLIHYGKQVSDEAFAETLLVHVSRTHRDVVRQFSKHYVIRDGGAVRPVLTAAQVMNALRAESALDERVACEEESKPAHICSRGKQAQNDSQQSKKNQNKGKQQKGKGRYKSKQPNEARKQTGRKKETRTCYKCDEVGHLPANCPSQKSDSADKLVISEFKRWENKKANRGNSGKRGGKNTSALCCHEGGASIAIAASVKTPAGTELEWILDSASDGHVCNQSSVLHNVRNEEVHCFQGLRKDHADLLLLNTDRRYRLKATAVAVYAVQSLWKEEASEVVLAQIGGNVPQFENSGHEGETHASVVSHESVKLVLPLALHYGLLSEHVGYVTAFLNGPIGNDVKIYMEMPDYFDNGSGPVLRNDVIIAANAQHIKLVVDELERKFSIRTWVATPQALGPLSLPATSDDEDVNNPNVPYCAMVDCMQYLVQCTRPDLANANGEAGAAVPARGLRLRSRVGKKESPDLHLVVYPDADLGNEKDDKHLITGYVLKLNGCTCAYKSRKQRSVADDTCCAEFVAASECPTMIVWTHNLCNELNLTRYYPTVLYQDNQATITVLTEVDGNYKTKSVDVKYHKVRDFHERGEFEELYRPSSENLADIFTKALGPTQFRKFRQQLNVMPLLTAIEDSKAGGRN
ncbi:hypothetical protein ON010_g1640 [Phytophthora cinnamomi]|nr:hypothetical protein ON010_g1640 [Phytophthora cinnamomi]